MPKGSDSQVISILPPREGWDQGAEYDIIFIDISILPPREGWDYIAKVIA